jgi:hypothetical protein
MREIDLDRSLYDLTQQYPELIDILAGLGFLAVKNSMMRSTMGRVTTIPQGCKKMGLDLDEIKRALKERGFVAKV